MLWKQKDWVGDATTGARLCRMLLLPVPHISPGGRPRSALFLYSQVAVRLC